MWSSHQTKVLSGFKFWQDGVILIQAPAGLDVETSTASDFSGLDWSRAIQFCFSKVRFIPLCFYKRPTFVPVCANQKKSEEDFRFYEKEKIAFSICSAGSCYRGSSNPKQGERHLQAPSPGNTLGISASSCRSFELCLCFISVYFVHPLATCILS